MKIVKTEKLENPKRYDRRIVSFFAWLPHQLTVEYQYKNEHGNRVQQVEKRWFWMETVNIEQEFVVELNERSRYWEGWVTRSVNGFSVQDNTPRI